MQRPSALPASSCSHVDSCECRREQGRDRDRGGLGFREAVPLVVDYRRPVAQDAGRNTISAHRSSLGTRGCPEGLVWLSTSGIQSGSWIRLIMAAFDSPISASDLDQFSHPSRFSPTGCRFSRRSGCAPGVPRETRPGFAADTPPKDFICANPNLLVRANPDARQQRMHSELRGHWVAKTE